MDLNTGKIPQKYYQQGVHRVESVENDFQREAKVTTLQPMMTVSHMPQFVSQTKPQFVSQANNIQAQNHDEDDGKKRLCRLEQAHPDIVGRTIRHRWVIDGVLVYCTGTVLRISAPGTVPEESDDGEFIPGICYDIKYDDEDFIRHLILEGDWQRGDIKVLGRAPTMA